MLFGLHLLVDLLDFSVGGNDVGDAPRVAVRRLVARPVREAHLPIGVTEQREVELELLGKFLVVFDRVEADAEDLRVLRFVFTGSITEPASLGRSARCVSGRVEPKDNALTLE